MGSRGIVRALEELREIVPGYLDLLNQVPGALADRLEAMAALVAEKENNR